MSDKLGCLRYLWIRSYHIKVLKFFSEIIAKVSDSVPYGGHRRRDSESVVFNSGPKMALRSGYALCSNMLELLLEIL